MSEFGSDNSEALLRTEGFLTVLDQIETYNNLNFKTRSPGENLDGLGLSEKVDNLLVGVNSSFEEYGDDDEANTILVNAVREALLETHGNLLDNMGLGLSDTPNEYGGEKAKPRGYAPFLKIKIADEDRFIRTVDGFYVTNNRTNHVCMRVSQLVDSYLDDIKYGGYNLRHTDDPDPGKIAMRKTMADMQLGHLPDLQGALERIVSRSSSRSSTGSSAVLKRMQIYSNHYDAGTFPEYIEAEFKGLVANHDQWHKDLDAGYFSINWGKAVRHLAALRDTEPRSDFYPELLYKLQDDFELAVNEILELQTIINSPNITQEPYWADIVSEIRGMKPALIGAIEKWHRHIGVTFTHPMLEYQPVASDWPDLTVEEIIILLPDKIRETLSVYGTSSREAISTSWCLKQRMDRLIFHAFGIAQRDESLSDDEDLFLEVTDTGMEVIDRLGAKNEHNDLL